MFSYALSPAVNALERWRVPRWIGAALMVLAVVGGFGWTGYSLAGDTAELFEPVGELLGT
jgi:predicted PurR-regulated permease PerM